MKPDPRMELAAELPADDPAAKKRLSHYYELLRERMFREQVTKERIRLDRRVRRDSAR